MTRTKMIHVLNKVLTDEEFKAVTNLLCIYAKGKNEVNKEDDCSNSYPTISALITALKDMFIGCLKDEIDYVQLGGITTEFVFKWSSLITSACYKLYCYERDNL